MNPIKKIITCSFATLFGLLLLALMSLFILQILGYSFNKNYIGFNKEQCVAENYDNGSSNDISSCVYWIRTNYLETTQQWKNQFVVDEEYCATTYGPGIIGTVGRIKDSKCSYELFKEAQVKENLDFLLSDEHDGIFNFCAQERCPEQTLFR